jgi:hypothetical protein
LQKIAVDIYNFISENSETAINMNPKEFPNSPFDYIFLPEQNLVLHCINLEVLINDRYFFQNLSIAFSSKNIHLIHIWEDVWNAKQPIVKSRILSLLRKSETIPARLTKVRRIDKPMLDKFLIDNHLQGTVGAKLKYGLFLPKRYFRVISDEKLLIEHTNSEEILVAVASFSNAKKIMRNDQEFRSHELIRFANLKGFTVVGGLDKLLKNFIREQNPDDIMTYADADWSDGKNYEKLGFERIEQTKPLMFEVDSQGFIRELAKYDDFPDASANKQNKLIYNSGNWKFLMKLSDGK